MNRRLFHSAQSRASSPSLQAIRHLAILVVAGLLAACQNPYAEFYTDYGNTGTLPPVGQPSIQTGTGDPDRDIALMFEEGYGLIGAASFTGPQQEGQKAIIQAKKVGASIVVVSGQYLTTKSGAIPITTPTSNTAYTSGNINTYNSYGGYGYGSYSGTTTVYGSTTTYIPYSVDHYDQVALFFAPLERNGLLRQSVYGRLAGYEDVNDADRLGRDPAMRWIVGGKAVERGGASTSQMGRFETELLATNDNLTALAELSGIWIDRVHDRNPPKLIVLDMDSSVSPTHGEQEGTAYNGHFGCTCYHPLFVFNQFGDLERCTLRPGNVHSAHEWRDVLEPVVARYRDRLLRRYFRGDAAFALPGIFKFLEAEGFKYAIRLPANKVLQDSIAHLLKRPVGRPPKDVRRYHANFSYQAASWTKPRRVVAKVEWHPGELYPRVGFIVTNLSRPTERVVVYYNQRGTAEQHIKEGKNAIKWTRLSCRRFDHNAVRLQLHALAYNLGNFMRTLALPDAVEQWSLTSLREKLIKIGAKIVRHGRYVTFQMAEVAIPRDLFADIMCRIDRLRPKPCPA